jgi:uncharacterized protein YggT (Ycf19 family)
MAHAGGYGPLSLLVELYMMTIFVYVLLSWLPDMRYRDWFRTLGSICEPFLSIFRRIIPPMGGMIDLSPMAAIFALILLGMILRGAGL